MKSKLFKRELDRKIFDELLLLAKIDKQYFTELANMVNEKSKKGMIPKEDDFLIIASKSNYTVDDLNKIFRVATFLVMQEKDMEDSLDFIYSDLTTDERFTEKVLVEIKDKIESMKPALINFINYSNKRSSIEKTFPSMSYFTTSCSISTRFYPEYNSENDKSEDYKCNLIETIPVVVLQMDIDNFGKSKSFSLALTESELSEYINELQLAKLQLEKLSSSLKHVVK